MRSSLTWYASQRLASSLSSDMHPTNSVIHQKPVSASLMTPNSGWTTRFQIQSGPGPEGVTFERRHPHNIGRRNISRRGVLDGSFWDNVESLIRNVGGLGKGLLHFFKDGVLEYSHEHTFKHDWGERKKIVERTWVTSPTLRTC